MVFILSLDIILKSCKEEQPDPYLPFSWDCAVLLKTHVKNYTPNKIDFYLDVLAIQGSTRFDNVKEREGLIDTFFEFENYVYNGCKVQHNLTQIEYLDTLAYPTFYNALMIDQSNLPNNYTSRDPYNYRFENINSFLKNINYQGNTLLSAFSRNGKLENDVLTIYGDGFQPKWTPDICENLLDLTHKTAGSCSAYDAINDMIDYVAIHSPDSNRSITIFLINKDDSLSSHSIEELAFKAENNHIKINTVFLSYSSYIDFRSMMYLTNRTGGFSMLGGIWEHSGSFFMMNQILKNNVQFYRLHITLTIEAPSKFGSSYLDYVKISGDTYLNLGSQLNFLLEKP